MQFQCYETGPNPHHTGMRQCLAGEGCAPFVQQAHTQPLHTTKASSPVSSEELLMLPPQNKRGIGEQEVTVHQHCNSLLCLSHGISTGKCKPVYSFSFSSEFKECKGSYFFNSILHIDISAFTSEQWEVGD